MGELLDRVLDAHGGLDRWRSLSTVQASIVTGGELWGVKGLVQDPAPRRMTVSLHEQRASVQPFGATTSGRPSRPTGSRSRSSTARSWPSGSTRRRRSRATG
jgi:hypothetical protein